MSGFWLVRTGQARNATDGLGIAKVDSWLPVSRVSCWLRDMYKVPSDEVLTVDVRVSDSEGNGADI